MVDINFLNFTNDPIGSETILKSSILFNQETREKMLSFVEQNQLSLKHNYSLDEYGLKEDAVNKVFRAYRNEFNLKLEACSSDRSDFLLNNFY